MLLVPTLAAVTFALADDSGVGVRNVPERGDVAADVSTAPSASLTFNSRTSTLGIGYTARFSLFDFTRTHDYGLQQLANVNYTWGTQRLHLTFTLTGSYGQVLFYNAVVAAPTSADAPPGGVPTTMPPTTMQPAPARPAALLPEASVLTIVGLNASLSAYYQFSRRWSGFIGTGFGVGGGINGSEANLPFHYGPSAGVGAGYQLNAYDTLSSSLTGGVDFAPKTHGRFQTITLLETLTHRFAPMTTGSLGAGVTYVQTRPSAHAKKTRNANAAGIASLNQGFKLDGGALLTSSVGATLLSSYDPVLGTVTQSLGGGVGVGWARKRLTFGAGMQAGRSLPLNDPNAYTSYGATAISTYQLSQTLQFRAGAYWTRQVLPPSVNLATSAPDRWGATLGVTIAMPPVKF